MPRSVFARASHVLCAALLVSVLSSVTATATEWPENETTCARLASLLTVAEVEKITGRKPVKFAPVEADSSESCKLNITIPGAKVPRPGMSGMALQLKQLVSENAARERVTQGIMLAGGLDKATEIARDPRGVAYQFNYGFDYAAASVDAAELSVLVRDSSLDGPKVSRALGELLFRKALASPAMAAQNISATEITGYVAFTPMLALTERCMNEDMPQHAETRKVVDASPLKSLKLKPVTAMSPYAQRWIAANRYEEMNEKRLKPLQQATPEALAGECQKMTAELPAFLATMNPALLKALSK